MCGVKRFELAGTDAHGGVPGGTSLAEQLSVSQEEKSVHR